MYILAISGKENEGAYALESENNKRMVYVFLDKDDAVRYAGLLEADNFPEMSVVEVWMIARSFMLAFRMVMNIMSSLLTI